MSGSSTFPGVDVAKHNAEADRMRAEAGRIERVTHHCMNELDKLDGPQRIKVLRKLIAAYGIYESDLR